MEYYRLILYISFGILPSLIWLSYYLAKDLHPEPRRMVLKVFFLGAIATLPVILIQIGLYDLLLQIQLQIYAPLILNIIKWFVIIAFTEELFKYVVVRLAVYNNKVLDEPLDVMLYMVVAALGFAAAENILYLFSPLHDSLSFNQILATTAVVSFIRFVGATFLHTLCSALVGYLLVKSLSDPSKRLRLTFIGILLATLLHGLYDFSIISLDGVLSLLIPLTIITVLAVFMVYDFDEVKKLKGICKI